MKITGSFRSLLTVIILLSSAFYLGAQAKDSNKINWGFIFNTSSFISGIENYQAGFGFKAKDLFIIEKTRLNLRGLIDFDINDFFDDYSIKAGAAIEAPFIYNKRISPYWGLFTDVTLHYSYFEPSVGVWTKQIDIPIAVGAMLGIEVFIFDFISFFAEYSFSFAVTNTFLSSSSTADQVITNMKFLSDLGNGSKIGIVIYFEPVINLDEGKK